MTRRRFQCRVSDEGRGSTSEPAIDHEDAAEEWAEIVHSESGGDWTGGPVIVQEMDADDQPLGEPIHLEVTIDWSPSFSASRIGNSG